MPTCNTCYYHDHGKCTLHHGWRIVPEQGCDEWRENERIDEMTNIEVVEKIIEKYVRDYCGDSYYNAYRYDKDDEEFEMQKEVKEHLESVNAVYDIKFESGYSSCGYDNDFLAIAWIEDGKIILKTILLECM